MKNHTRVCSATIIAWAAVLAVGCGAGNGKGGNGAGSGGASMQGGSVGTGGQAANGGAPGTGGGATGGSSAAGGSATGGIAGGTGGTTRTDGGQATGGNASGGQSAAGGGASGGTTASSGSGGRNGTGGGGMGGSTGTGTSTGGKATGGSVSTGCTATGGTSAAGGATGTPGCDGNATPPTSPSRGYLTIDVNGTSRQYALELPTGYDGKTPFPVIFTFHGTTMDGQSMLAPYYGNVRNGAAGRAILVAPNGLSRNGETGWLGSGGIEQVDIDFFDAMVAQLKAHYCVDPGRFFAQGHSAGALMSNQMGCIRSNVLRGIGPVAGWGPQEGKGVTCGGKVAAFIGHNPYEGDPAHCAKFDGGTCPWNAYWDTFGWPTTQYWTKKDGCDDPGPMPTAPYDGNSQTGDPLPSKSFSGCDPNYPVTLCLYDYQDNSGDGPHAYPPWIAKPMIDFWLALPKVQ